MAEERFLLFYAFLKLNIFINNEMFMQSYRIKYVFYKGFSGVVVRPCFRV